MPFGLPWAVFGALGRSQGHFLDASGAMGALGASWVPPGVPQMPLRCLPDASQMPPRCLPDVSKSLTNQVQKRNLELFSTSLCAEFRYGSDGESHLGWGPCKSSVFDEKHTTVFVHVFVCIRYASVYIRMHPYASVCVRMRP